MSTENMTFIENRDLLQRHLVTVRKAAGWTAEELASKIGVTKPTILNIENDINKMSQPIYMAIMCVLSDEVSNREKDDLLCSVLGLIFDDGKLEPNTKEIALTYVAGLSQSKKKYNNITMTKGLKTILGGVVVGGITALGLLTKALLKK